MSDPILSTSLIEDILARLPSLTIGVVGDLFLDRYLDLDAALTEPSLETGLDAYQVVRVRSIPGAAGTTINNLAALGVGRIVPVAVLGDDGEGHELKQALAALRVVDPSFLTIASDRRTPTYTKPMLSQPGGVPRELNRLDIKNRVPMPSDLERSLLDALDAVRPMCDAVHVQDQVSEADCGAVTARVRQRLADRGDDGKFVLADSRERIGLFRNVCLKPNERECRQALGGDTADALELARRVGRPVFCTRGPDGILVADSPATTHVPGFPVFGEIDIVGAGDATSAGIVCARACGATLPQAAAFGCLVASITIQQLGTTGTATPAQVRERWHEACRQP